MTITNGRPGDSVNRNTGPRVARVAVTCPECECTHYVRVSETVFPTHDRHYKLAELEKMLGRSRKTLKRHIYSGKLKAEKLGGRDWFVSETALKQYMEG